MMNSDYDFSNKQKKVVLSFRNQHYGERKKIEQKNRYCVGTKA
jgi:hypothetical protein